MRPRTAQKTGRTAAMQAEALERRSFPRYTAMVGQFSGGYLRPLSLRLPPVRRAC